MLLPSTYKVVRHQVVATPQQQVFDFLVDVKNHDMYLPWWQNGTETKKIYSKRHRGKGAGYSWQSSNEDIGSGWWKISNAEAFTRVTNEVQFGNHEPVTITYELTPHGTGTSITWTLQGATGWNPLNRIFMLFADRLFGPDGEYCLNHLRKTMQSMPQVLLPEVREFPYRFLIGCRRVVPIEGLGEFFATSLALTSQTIRSHHSATLVSKPLSLYYRYASECDVFVGYAVSQPMMVAKPMMLLQPSWKRAVTTDVDARYDQLVVAWQRVSNWCEQTNTVVEPVIAEEYIGDALLPNGENNPKPRTRLYAFPVAQTQKVRQ
jgi:hypothetical protein